MQSKFTRSHQHNNSTYACICCSRQTRETGLGEAGVDLCAFCFEVAGLENSFSDGNVTSAEFNASFAAYVKQYGKRAHLDCVNIVEEVEQPKETKQQAKARRAKARRAAKKGA